MKILIVEDDFTSRMLLQRLMTPYGEICFAPTGSDAVRVFKENFDKSTPFDLVCLDIMLPDTDGQSVLNQIRDIESKAGIMLGDGTKIVMTTSLADSNNIFTAFRASCDGYLVKPVEKVKLQECLKTLGLVK